MEIRVPAVGESVVEALLAKWHCRSGEVVRKDQPICEIETDKITMDIVAELDGQLVIRVAEGITVPVGAVIAELVPGTVTEVVEQQITNNSCAPTSPAVRQVMREQGVSAGQLQGSGPGGRIVMEDLQAADLQSAAIPVQRDLQPASTVRSEEPPTYRALSLQAPAQAFTPTPGEERVRMSPLRKRIAERLLQARQQTAMLTTFNEADLGALQDVRARLKKAGRAVGLLPYFVKACCDALHAFPAVNARIDGDDIVYHHFCHVGIAVSGEKGLVVPVVRSAEELGLQAIDQAITGFVEKIKTNKLAIADLEGGTFTITNGGTYGSMLSTPIINPPQSGVLGMHSIAERPVARDGQIVIRPVMYLALSYDHRIIDGREAVGFLKMVKERIEDAEWLANLQ